MTLKFDFIPLTEREHSAIFYDVCTSLIDARDLDMIRFWRNAPEINQHMLNQQEISAEQQQQWFQGLQGDCEREYRLIFYRNEPIGVRSLIQINQQSQSATSGMYIYPEQYRNSFIPFSVAIAGLEYEFFEKQLERLDIFITKENKAAIRYNKALGYQQTHADDTFVYMQCKRDDYLKAKPSLIKKLDFILQHKL